MSKRRRRWIVGPDRNEVLQAMAEAESIGHRLGGVFAIAPIREPMGDGDYVTTGWVFEWGSYAPAALPRDDQPPVDDPTPDELEEALATAEALEDLPEEPEDAALAEEPVGAGPQS